MLQQQAKDSQQKLRKSQLLLKQLERQMAHNLLAKKEANAGLEHMQVNQLHEASPLRPTLVTLAICGRQCDGAMLQACLCSKDCEVMLQLASQFLLVLGVR